jgi:hypothetical protein
VLTSQLLDDAIHHEYNAPEIIVLATSIVPLYSCAYVCNDISDTFTDVFVGVDGDLEPELV